MPVKVVVRWDRKVAVVAPRDPMANAVDRKVVRMVSACEKATVPPRAAKGIVLAPMEKAEVLVPKVIAPLRVAKVPPLGDASIRKRCGSNSTKTATAAFRRKRLLDG